MGYLSSSSGCSSWQGGVNWPFVTNRLRGYVLSYKKHSEEVLLELVLFDGNIPRKWLDHQSIKYACPGKQGTALVPSCFWVSEL